MFLVFVLLIFYSCSSDSDLLLATLNQPITEETGTVGHDPNKTSPTVPTPNSELDSTKGVDKTTNIPKAIATPSNGSAPLEVKFTIDNPSTDSSGFDTFLWKFNDGTQVSAGQAEYLFKETGEYTVELTATNEDGQVLTDAVMVTVTAPQNQAPVAAAAASDLSGQAPLTVDFIGTNSSDDKGIVGYYWGFNSGSSSSPNASHTFDNPGTYSISLTVTDSEGLTDTADLTITVEQASVGIEAGNLPCGTGSRKADETGAKVWCWSDITIPSYSENKGVNFSNGELCIDSECYEKQVTKVGNQLKFRIDPTDPGTGSWCSRDYNMRAEIRTAPWDIRHARGTEEWFGWSYTFGDDYVIDQNNQWLFWQVHHGVVGESPQTELMVIKDGQFNGHSAGELYVVNNTVEHASRYNPTGIVPRAGEKLDIVVHTVWDTGSNGWLQVWINGEKAYDQKVSTIYSSSPWAGNAKWGIYKWPWAETAGVEKSRQQGITHMETFMGPLRIVTRRPGDVDYGTDSYSLVAPD